MIFFTRILFLLLVTSLYSQDKFEFKNINDTIVLIKNDKVLDTIDFEKNRNFDKQKIFHDFVIIGKLYYNGTDCFSCNRYLLIKWYVNENSVLSSKFMQIKTSGCDLNDFKIFLKKKGFKWKYKNKTGFLFYSDIKDEKVIDLQCI